MCGSGMRIGSKGGIEAWFMKPDRVEAERCHLLVRDGPSRRWAGFRAEFRAERRVRLRGLLWESEGFHFVSVAGSGVGDGCGAWRPGEIRIFNNR